MDVVRVDFICFLNNILQNGAGVGTCIGCSGGYGALYCFAFVVVALAHALATSPLGETRVYRTMRL